MTEKHGVTIVTLEDQARSASAVAWTADRRLGLTADRTRVVGYNDVEAAFLFKAPGKTVSVAECALYGISAEQQTSPREWPPRAPEPPAAKEADPPEDKAVTRAEVEDKSVRRSGKKAR